MKGAMRSRTWGKAAGPGAPRSVPMPRLMWRALLSRNAPTARCSRRSGSECSSGRSSWSEIPPPRWADSRPPSPVYSASSAHQVRRLCGGGCARGKAAELRIIRPARTGSWTRSKLSERRPARDDWAHDGGDDAGATTTSGPVRRGAHAQRVRLTLVAAEHRRTEAKRPAERMPNRPSSSYVLERATGFEPATFSLGS